MSDPRSPPRRPGVRFEAPAPAPADDLPRMDVAAFVGFAAAGPPHVPVAVESEAAFAELFGPDLALGWDPASRAPARAHLGPAVRAFFRNGGRRCHVVRVARDEGPGRARAARFPLHGLVRRGPDGEWRTALASARSEGSWADGLQAAASLSREALPPPGDDDDPLLRPDFLDGDAPPWVTLPRPASVAPGDTLRVVVVVGDDLAEGWCRVADARREADGSVSWRRAPDVAWFGAPTLPAPSDVAVRWDDPSGAPRAASCALVALDGGRATLRTGDAAAAHLAPGCVLRAAGAPTRLVCVDEVTVTRWRLSGAVLDLQHEPLALPDGAVSHVSWRDPDDPAVTHRVAVGRAAEGPGWVAPPASDDVKEARDLRVASLPDGAVLRLEGPGAGGATGVVGLLRLTARAPDEWSVEGPLREVRGAPVAPEGGRLFVDRLERVTVGLRVRDAVRSVASLDALGLDPAGDRAFAALPSDRELFAPRPRWRENPHAALWEEARAGRFPLAGDASLRAGAWLPLGLSLGVERYLDPWLPDGSALERDGVAAVAPTEAAVDGGCFLDGRLTGVPLDGLMAAADRMLDDDGAGGAPRGLHALLTLPEVTLAAAPDAAWAGRVFLRAAPAPPAELPAPPEPPPDLGVFRDRAPPVVPPAPALPARFAPPARWSLAPPLHDDASDAPAPGPLAVQAELVRACAARGDVVALLSAPPHLRARGAARHAEALRRQPFGGERARALSLAALYHPWCVGREADGALRASAPEGAVAGHAAEVAALRGAWGPVARRPLRGVLALSPALDGGEVDALLAGSVNPLALEPAGALALEAATLTDDDDLRPLGVRRLMTLLRRAALERGERYAFEPLGDALLRGAEQGFEALLRGLFDRGALAGRRAAEAFRVRATQGGDGRLAVEVRVAPSQPLRFLTVRLERRDDQLRLAEEG